MVSLTVLLCAIAASFAILATYYVVHRMLVSATLLHATSLAGVLVVLYLAVYDVLRVTNIIMGNPTIFRYVYVLASTIASILSCYVVLHVGTNFYRTYNVTKNFLLFAPITLTFGSLGLSTFAVVRMVLKDEQQPEPLYYRLSIYLSGGSGALALIYAAYPLRSLRRNKHLRPEQTALSVLRLLTVVLFFAAHYGMIAFIVLEQPFMDLTFDAIAHTLLVLVFLVCLIPFPRGIIKRVKRRMLGVEELTIGGNFRPSMIAEQIHTPHVVVETDDTSDTSDNEDADATTRNDVEISAPITAEVRPPQGRWMQHELDRQINVNNGPYTPNSSQDRLLSVYNSYDILR